MRFAFVEAKFREDLEQLMFVGGTPGRLHRYRWTASMKSPSMWQAGTDFVKDNG